MSEGGRDRELVFANTRSARDRNFAGVQKSRGGISAAAAQWTRRTPQLTACQKEEWIAARSKGVDRGCRRDFGEEFRVGEASVTGSNTRGPEGTVAMMKRCGPRDSK